MLKTWLTFEDMVPYKKYLITGGKRHKVTYGERILLELDYIYQIYLNEKHNVLRDDEIKEIIKNKVYLGKMKRELVLIE